MIQKAHLFVLAFLFFQLNCVPSKPIHSTIPTGRSCAIKGKVKYLYIHDTQLKDMPQNGVIIKHDNLSLSGFRTIMPDNLTLKEIPLAGATITLESSSLPAIVTTISDKEGNYRFENIPCGSDYIVACAKADYKDRSFAVSMGAYPCLNLPFTLLPVSEAMFDDTVYAYEACSDE